LPGTTVNQISGGHSTTIRDFPDRLLGSIQFGKMAQGRLTRIVRHVC
jgi:hypothetical protein